MFEAAGDVLKIELWFVIGEVNIPRKQRLSFC
jgi:hypothetical protein